MAIAEAPPQETAEDPTATPARKKPQAGEKIVFARDGDNAWVEIGRGVGTSDAVRDEIVGELSQDEQDSGEFVAVPERSWKPKTRKVTTIVKHGWN